MKRDTSWLEQVATAERVQAPPVRSAAGAKAVILGADRTPWMSNSTIELQREIKVLNRPLLEWQIDALQAAGIRNICLAMPGESTAFEPVSDSVFTWRHAHPMGSAGVLGPLCHWLGDQPFILVCASTFIDARSVKALLEHAASADTRWAGTIAVGRSQTPFDAREAVTVDGGGRMHHIYRGHRSEERRTTNYATGLFLLSGMVLDHLPNGRYFDLKDQLMPALREKGFHFDTLFADQSLPLLRPEDRLTLQSRLLMQQAEGLPSGASAGAGISPGASVRGKVVMGDGVVVEAGARVIGPVQFGPGCRIGEGATVIGPACLGSHCRLERDAVLIKSLLEDGVVLGVESQVDHSLLGARHVVEPKGVRHAMDGLAAPLSPSFNIAGQRSTPWQGPQSRSWATAYDAAKRALDLVVAAMLTMLLLPLGLVIASAIKLDSPGPVLFIQRRCGFGGREFPLLKFRTMVADADRMLKELRQGNEMDGPTFKMTLDPRITSLGAWLRRTSLDELPQLLNVLAGHMSLVGPRPLKMSEMVSNAHWRDVRLSVMPGITGLWQVEGRDSRHFHHWIQLDLEYVRNRSLMFDLRILFRTAGVLRRGT